MLKVAVFDDVVAARAERPAIATAVLAAAGVTAMLSFGAWQEWWIGAELMALAAVAAMPRARYDAP